MLSAPHLQAGRCIHAFKTGPAQKICPRFIRRQSQRPPAAGKETGYTKEDSAGQENIYPVESKAFVTGQNSRGGNAATAVYAGIAAAIAIAAISAGFVLTKGKPPQDVVEDLASEGPTKSLSSISRTLKSGAKKAAEQVQETAPSLN